MARLALGAVGFVAVALLASDGSAAQNDTTLISIAQVVPGGKANADSFSVSSSADGRFVAFSTLANNLVPEDTNTDEDVYVRDTVDDTITLITPGDGPDDAGGNLPSISDDGQRVAFRSFDQLTADDTNNANDAYVFDFGTGVTTLASRATGTGPAGTEGIFSSIAISGDGSSVAFSSRDNTLDPAHDTDVSTTGAATDIFVRDLDTDTTELVSRNATADGNSAALRPSLDEDGSHVGFDTSSTNLSAADTDTTDDVYVFNRATETLTLVSRANGAAGAKGNASSKGPSLTADGNEVAFSSDATNLDPDDPAGEAAAHVTDVYVRKISTNATELTSRATGASGASANKVAQSATISADGTQVVFLSPADNLSPDQPDPTNAQNQAYLRDRATDTTSLESRADGAAGPIADANLDLAEISSDGTALAFASRATNLDPADTDSVLDVFLRDMGAGQTELASQSPVEPPVNANGESRDPAISADGRYVAFSSFGTNIDPAATDNRSDVFVRDTQTGVTVLASREGESGPEGDDGSVHPSISADGRYVAFESEAENLVATDGDGQPDVYVRDLVANTTTLVSVHNDGSNVGGFPAEPSISGDGTRIAFDVDISYRGGDDNGLNDIYVRDLAADETLLVSRADGSSEVGDGDSRVPEISADGGSVAFESTADNLTDDGASPVQQVFVRTIDGDQTVLASRADGANGATGNAEAREPAISGDGTVVAFQSDSSNLDPDKTSTTTQVFVRDLEALDTDVGSRATDGSVANNSSNSPDLSDDGTYIGFRSSGTNLDPGAINSRPDVFHRDLAAGATVLASRADGFSGAEGNETADDASLSEHGRFVAFESNASNLDPADTDPTTDVYLRDVLGADTVAPETTITGGPAEGSLHNTNQFTFTFTVDEPGSTSECRIDGGAFSACSGSFDTPALGQGSHTFEVRSTDRVGNVEAPAASRTFTVDTIAPNTSLTSPPSGPINDSTPSFEFTSTQVGSTFECKVDGAAYSACASGITVGPLADGGHTFRVRATDPAGNIDSSSALATFTVDTAAPDTALTSPPSGPINDSTPSFEFTSTQVGSTFECKVDGAAYSACASGITVGPLADGGHTFRVRATDPAGNIDSSSALATFTVDTAAPDTALTSPPSGPINDSTPSFEFTSTQVGSTFECKVDGAAYSACASGITVGPLADGGHTFRVRATDPAGNIDSSSALATFTVDTAAPDTALTSPPSGPINDSTPSFEFTSTQVGSTFECKVDGGAFTACNSGDTFGPLADGAHTFAVRAIDPAGNTDQSPAQSTFTVDTGAPDTALTSPVQGPTPDSSPSFDFTSTEAGSTFQCSVDGGAASACNSGDTFGPLADGDHTFAVQSTDPAGNTDQSPAQTSFTVDTAAPDTALTNPPQGNISNPAPIIDFSSPDPAATFQCALDGVPFTPCNSGLTLGPLADGEHTFAVRAIDPVGNIDQSPAQTSFTLDTLISGREVSAKRKQKQRGRTVKAVAKVATGEAVTATLTGKVTPGKGLKLRDVTKAVADGEGAKLVGTLKRKQSEAVLEQLAEGKKLKAKLVVEITDDVGNLTTTTEKVKLKG